MGHQVVCLNPVWVAECHSAGFFWVCHTSITMCSAMTQFSHCISLFKLLGNLHSYNEH